MATVIDTLFLELGIDSGKFGTQAKEAESRLDRMSASFGRAEKSAAKSSKGLEKQAVQSAKSTKQAKNLTQAVGALTKGFFAFTALVMGSNALDKMIREGAQANVELDNLSRNIGISRNQLQAWGGMAEMAGGSAEGMKGSLAGLSMGITRLTTMGDTSMVPFFNAFGVALLNADGKARDLDSVMLDLADRFAKMDRVQAYNLAKSMGLDDGTINTLMLGRAEMEKMLEMQRNLYRSGEKEIQVSRELTQARGYLNAQWDSLKAMLADALAPILLKIIKMVSGFVDYLMKHENSMKHVFEGLAFVLGAVLVPVFIAAAASLLAFIAPFAPFILTVGALGAAFLLLYDDYKTWAEGGKSLLDWKFFDNYIKTSKISTDSLGSAFVYLLTGYTSWADAANGLLDWLKLKGFIDENGLSIKSLKEGFHNLYLEIKNYLMPYFEALSDTFTAMMNGDWEGMKKGMGRMVKEAGNVVTDVVGWGVEHAAGVIDTSTGHDPNAEGSLQSQAKSATNAAKQMIGSKASRSSMNYKISGKNRHNQQIIAEEAEKAGIDPSIMLAMAHIETGGSFNERAKNPGSSASGLFQFMKGTRGKYGLDGNTVFDARKNSAAGAKMLNENRAYFKKRFGREPSAGELYLMHQQGIGGGTALMANPNALAIDVLTRAHKGNRKRAEEIIRKNGGRMDMTAGQFADKWIGKGNSLQKAYQKGGNQFVAGQAVAAGAQRGMQSMQQGEAVRAQNVTNNNQRTTQVSINGGIHVQSSASTITGTMDDASAAARDRMVQIVPAMV
ncbi:transglycosylase SLT domain-containing protein [Neisseria elongata]|uniref:transglycosylase SLT domain-containing protein n=1 Tax=Neisseria elongata TaxID=495 RepID=UPI000E0CCE50|nr:transglycosylase SLT domain-containing protein [Neisseria elongata]